MAADSKKVWFITGASRGFGREWTTAAMNRGDCVAAAARDVAALEDLQHQFGDRLFAVRLDVRDRSAAFRAVRSAHEYFGRLDVVVNNAGYGQFGFIEELTEADSRAQMDTNFFGPLWVTQASLPYLRAQRSGHIIQVSSVAGQVGVPNLGLYNASKWALEGMSEALAEEIASFGIHVTLIEPGLFKTDWNGSSARRTEPQAAYAEAYRAFSELEEEMEAQAGDPKATVAALMHLVDSEAPPLRVLFGSTVLAMVDKAYRQRLDNWRNWQHLAISAHGAGSDRTGSASTEGPASTAGCLHY